MTDSDEDLDEFLEIYLEESKEETDQLVELLLRLERNPNDAETLREAFRLLHTFKGSTGMMGYDRINGLAHDLETRFDACRSGRERLTTETVSVTLRCVDFFRDFLTRLADGNVDQGDPQPLMEELAGITVVLPTPLEAGERSEADDDADDADTERESESAQAVHPVAAMEPERERKPVVPASTESAGPMHAVTVSVRMTDHIELPELKARLIIARLQAHGEIVGVDPPLEMLDKAPHPITLRVRVRTTSQENELVESIDVEGVAAAYVAKLDNELPALTGTTSEKIAPSTTLSDEAAQPAGESLAVAATKTGAITQVGQKKGETESPVVSPAARVETIRVGTDRLDRLMNLAGELVVTNARFDQLASEIRLLFRSGGSIESGSPLAESLLRVFGADDELLDEQSNRIGDSGGFIGDDGATAVEIPLRRGWMEHGRKVAGQVSETVDQLARLSRSIQQAVLETRMIPIGPLFNRFRRTIRDLSLKQGKQVLLELEGEATELDKRMVDELGDPMVHLIRNALDHGIESTEQRIAAGKPAEGLIQLRAFHQSNHVVIEIVDDGAGIDVAKVRKRALAQGLASEAELKAMTDRDAFGFIWQAGFSTAETISDISGRGVGMDVVRDRIAALGGVVELDSRRGVGSTVSIRLPLTLAIVNALIVRFRGFRLAIPVTDVYEIHGVSRVEVFQSQGREMIDVRGKLLPLYGLDELFEWNESLPPAAPRTDGLVHAVLVRDGHRSLAIEVDDLDGNSDIVIKPLNEHYCNIPGLGGACVMGDGQVCLVLDTTTLTPPHRSGSSPLEQESP